MRSLPVANTHRLILDLAKKYDGKDRFYLDAIGIAVGHEKKRRETILADFDQETYRLETANCQFGLGNSGRQDDRTGPKADPEE